MRSYLLIFPQRTRGRNSTESARLVPLAANVETSVAMFDDIAQHMSNVGLTAALELRKCHIHGLHRSLCLTKGQSWNIVGISSRSEGSSYAFRVELFLP